MSIRVLIVDDSAFMRKLIAKYMNEDPELQVAGEACNGLEAVEMVKKLRPDAVTLDVEMPEMDGLEALKRMMREHPVPVIMVSSLTEEGASITVRALQAGAFDFIHKPSGSVSIDLHKVKHELCDKIKLAVRSPIRRRISHLDAPLVPPPIKPSVHRPRVEQIVAVGTSTGGPQALMRLLGSLPPSFDHPIVIVQHMPPQFTATLAKRLDTITPLRVSEAVHHEPLENGRAYVAPGNFHLNVVEDRGGGYRISLHQRDSPGRHRPSVKELFASVTALPGELKKHYVVMTGMGSDGADELTKAKAAEAATVIAEAQESCVVFGMPKAAIDTGAVDQILPLERIAACLDWACRKQS